MYSSATLTYTLFQGTHQKIARIVGEPLIHFCKSCDSKYMNHRRAHLYSQGEQQTRLFNMSKSWTCRQESVTSILLWEGLEGLYLWSKEWLLERGDIDARVRWQDSHRRVRVDSWMHLEHKVADRLSASPDHRWGMVSLWVAMYPCC